jgi:hypothetical protein
LENEITIFCPKRKCGKCALMVTQVEKAVKITRVPANISIDDSLKETLKYPTWILLTLVINGNVAVGGYVPANDVILNKLK